MQTRKKVYDYDIIQNGKKEDRKQPKKSKKYFHLGQLEKEYGRKFKDDPGVYSFTPYPPQKEEGKYKGYSVFKIGISSSKIGRRYDNYITYFPKGVYFNSFLTDINYKNDTTLNVRKHLEKIEKDIFKYVLDNDTLSKKIQSFERIQNEGYGEWIFTTATSIDNAFHHIASIYDLTFLGFVSNFNDEVSKEHDKQLKDPKTYFEGKIIFA